MANVNLDALIKREDFEVEDSNKNPFQNTPTIRVADLEERNFLFETLRKPDFQRETSDWDAEKICSLVESFLNSDLVPALIFWNSGGLNFVIDGAHRLSALIGWVLDDYGDGKISRSFFNHEISKEQIKAAEKTRELIKKRLGTYEDHKYAISNPDKVEKELYERAKRLAITTLQLQWVTGNSEKAENSFFKINEEATPINPAEKKLLKSRKKPNAIAARAISRAGTGHKYWSKFISSIRSDIEKSAKEINDILFSPELQTPIKTLDIPLGGKGYSSSTLALIFDLVNIINDIKNEDEVKDDLDGSKTLEILHKTKKLLSRISGLHPQSLGLHPAVYFYSIGGRYQISAFLGIIELIKDFEEKNYFIIFNKNRSRFEDFLINNKIIINQITVKYGSGIKSYKKIKNLLFEILELLNNGKTEDEIKGELRNGDFGYLNFDEKPEELENKRKNFSNEQKSATFLKDALNSCIRCKLCNSYLHLNSISIDHIIRKVDGGTGNINNSQITHPYCNTTEKN